MVKVIKKFDINLGSIAAAETTRQFSIIGDNGAIFSLEVKNAAGNYYNFKTNTFTSTYKSLKKKKITNGTYQGFIKFPAISSADQYDIYLYAESAHDTVHEDYSEVRFGDGSLDINSSIGSNSSLLKKVIYQYTDLICTLSVISPQATFQSAGNFVSMSVSTDTITVGRGNTVGKTAFSIAITAATDKTFQIARQPTISDLTAYTTVTMGSGVQIHGEDIWAGTVRGTGLIVDGGTSADDSPPNVTMDDDVSTSRWQVGDRITGNAALDAKTGDAAVTVTAINVGSNAKVFTMSEGIVIADNETLTFTPPYYHRWSLHSGSSIHQLLPGMRVWTSDALILENRISDYEDKTTYTTEVHNEDGSIDEVENTVVNASAPALDPVGFKPVITKGLVSQQLGNITFANQVKNDFDGLGAKFFAYGSDAIKTVNNTEIKLTDLKVELTAPTTTTTADTSGSASTTVAVADKEGTVQNVSTISGIGIASGAVNPTITSVTADGSGNWTVDVAQALESGVTLTVEGSGKTATITGYIEFLSVDSTANFGLAFDLEKFLIAT